MLASVRRKSRQEHFYLNEKERQLLEKKAAACGVSKSEYIRRMIIGVRPREFPPADYAGILEQLRKIALSMEQWTAIVKSSGNLETEHFGELLTAQYELIRQMTEEAYGDEQSPVDEEKVLYGSD